MKIRLEYRKDNLNITDGVSFAVKLIDNVDELTSTDHTIRLIAEKLHQKSRLYMVEQRNDPTSFEFGRFYTLPNGLIFSLANTKPPQLEFFISKSFLSMKATLLSELLDYLKDAGLQDVKVLEELNTLLQPLRNPPSHVIGNVNFIAAYN